MQSKKFEIVEIASTAVTVDTSMLANTAELFFNATEMAKAFGKRPIEWLRLPDAEAYINALLEVGKSHHQNRDDLIITRRGRAAGTWLHNDLGIAFARWLSPIFAVQLDRWTRKRLLQEHDRAAKRLEAKTGFRPLTDAVQFIHDPAKHYHYSNECDLINRIVLGMPAKAFRQHYKVEAVRDALTAEQLDAINRLQVINTGLIEAGMDYAQRKEHLIDCYQRRYSLARAA